MNSGEQVAQGVKNNAKILFENVENDKSTTEDNGVQFEIPLSKVGFLKSYI